MELTRDFVSLLVIQYAEAPFGPLLFHVLIRILRCWLIRCLAALLSPPPIPPAREHRLLNVTSNNLADGSATDLPHKLQELGK
jgi:hypothetical protein